MNDSRYKDLPTDLLFRMRSRSPCYTTKRAITKVLKERGFFGSNPFLGA